MFSIDKLTIIRMIYAIILTKRNEINAVFNQLEM